MNAETNDLKVLSFEEVELKFLATETSRMDPCKPNGLDRSSSELFGLTGRRAKAADFGEKYGNVDYGGHAFFTSRKRKGRS